MVTKSIILLLVLSISCLCSTRDVYIQPSEGEHCPGTPCYNITTFGKMADSFSNSSGLVVHFLEGTHLLDLQELVVFTNLTNAVFEGEGKMEHGFHETVWQSTVVIKCTEHSSTGIAFVDSSNITFRYITITNCGADMTSFCNTNIFCNCSLGYFKTIYSIAIDHVSIQNGTGTGLLVDTDGVEVIITDSSFAQNYIYGNFEGGNIAIVYIDSQTCDPRSYMHDLLISNTNTSFEDSEMEYSEGILIYLQQGSYSVTILLDSVIAYGNKGVGNIYIYAIQHIVPTYNLMINNFLSSHANGFGLIIVSRQDVVKQCPSTKNMPHDLTIAIIDSKFTYNNNSNDHHQHAVVFINLIGVKFTTSILIQSTDISHNIGFGLYLFLFSYQYKSLFFVTIENFTANCNTLPYHSSDMYSVIYTVFVTNLILRNVSITNNNNMTGLTVYHTAVVANGTLIFQNNTGIDGGGLAMYGNSYVMFHPDSALNFTNNSAKEKGGAIFVDTQLKLAPCFFQYSDDTLPESVKVTISGNTAGTAGTVLFGGDISRCVLFLTNQTFGSECFNKTFEYSAQTGPSVISSEPTDVCFCDDNNTINCSQTQLTMTAYPGEEINISVVTVGQLEGVAPGILQIKPLDYTDSSAVTELHNTSAMNCTTIALKPIYQTYALNVFGYIEHFKLLNISMIDCPLGFNISNKSKTCDCEELKNIIDTITCNRNTGKITRKGDVWIGDISDLIVVHKTCPFDYCNTAQVSFSLTDPDPQCALNRTGILCGRCQDGLSLALGTNNCIKCLQFSYLALIIPFAAAGFGLVALLMVLNLTVSIGTINGLIFYASIVKISESTGIFFPNGPIPVLSQFIAWLNLDLGIETCFYPGMTAYAKVWLQFVFPLYIWFIIATIIVLCRYSTWLSNKIGGNVVQVLATLILLSFTKIFRIFASALTWINLPSKVTVWYIDGNISYFSPEHYILMAAAVLFLLLAVPYVLALLFDAVIEKHLTNCSVFRRHWIKFKPFVDAYNGPYKDKCRFWTGLLLLVRMSFTLVSLHLDTFGTLIFITTSTTVLLSLLVTFEGVYQKKYLNILECSFLLNLGLLSALAAVYQNDNNSEQIVTTISISVALVTFSGVMFLHILLRFRHNFIEYCNQNAVESNGLLTNKDESSPVEQLVEPTSSEVFMRRESLIY